MAVEILDQYGERLAAVSLIPSHGGRFVVTAGGKEIFNKATSGQFPGTGELQKLLDPFVRS